MLLVYFFTAILIGLGLGAAAGLCFLVREVWQAVSATPEEDLCQGGGCCGESRQTDC